MKRSQFNKTHLATCLSVALGASMVGQVHAQDAGAEADVEVIKVSGIRGSLIESTATKRLSRGVVDSISAEDIGKFPDSNLAESLQRITGVSIDRANGEGSKVTIRGFGPDFNMVTLNGRAMPAASLNGTELPTSRAFDFADLASESVRAVEVYKTAKANIASGGIGGTINIITAKPLDNPGQHASIGVKALSDTTNRVGDDITPEFSGLFSMTNEDETLGLSVTASQQTRHSGSAGAYVTQWNYATFDGMQIEGVNVNDMNITNAPQVGDLYVHPQDIRYTISDKERVRTNAQVTLQFRPSDKVEATLDYTMSEQEISDRTAQNSSWYAFTPDRAVFTKPASGAPYTAVVYSEDGVVRDQAFAQQRFEQKNENDSLGLNVKYDVNENLTFVLDAHSSTAKGSPNGDFGLRVEQGIGANFDTGHSVDFSNPLPIMFVDFDDSVASGLNANGKADIGDIGTTVYSSNVAMQETDVNQFRLDGTYLLDNGKVDFGIESRSMESNSKSGNYQTDGTGGWGVSSPGTIPSGLISPIDFATVLDGLPGGAYTQGFVGDAAAIGAWALNYFQGAGNAPAQPGVYPEYNANQTIKEEISAMYAQLTWAGDIGDMPYNIVVGLRQEKTDLTSTGQGVIPQQIIWQSNNDFKKIDSGATENIVETNSYENILPSIDFDLNITDDLMGRISYSKTIARPSLAALAVNKSVGTNAGPYILDSNFIANGSNGNAALIPLESTNIDLSLEWYYDDVSYVSVGYYRKDVENFLGSGQVQETAFGLRDVSNGPRAQQALRELEEKGYAITDTNLFSYVAWLDQGGEASGIEFDSLIADVDAINATERDYDILPNSDDPEMLFRITKQLNTNDASVYGMEFAIQHFFGDSGFGVQANYTTVDGDVDYDVTKGQDSNQFALTGLSDTANLVGLYEKDNLQVRVAYNWRDTFLEGAGVNPTFVEDYSQLDIGASYSVSENLTVYLDAINVTDEDSRKYRRSVTELVNFAQNGARYAFGARYTF